MSQSRPGLWAELQDDIEDAGDVAALLRLAAEKLAEVAGNAGVQDAFPEAEEDAMDVARELEDLADRIETDYSGEG